MLTFWLFLILVIAWNTCKIHADLFDECRGVTMLTFVASSTDCNKYIFCDGEDSYEGECDDGDYFNPLYQTCDAQELVPCRFDTNNEVAPIVEDLTTTTMAPITENIITSTSTESTKLSTSDMTTPTIPTTRTTTKTTTTTTTTTTTSTISSSSSQPLIWTGSPASPGNVCPPMADPSRLLYITNARSCANYFVCYRGMSIQMKCPTPLHFNSVTAKCDYPERVKCEVNIYVSAREKCQMDAIDYYAHPSNCNYFYHCKSGFLFLEQCPVGYGWDYERRACTELKRANCFNQRRN